MHLYKSTVIKMSKIFFTIIIKALLMFSQSWQSTTLIMPREMQNLQVAFSKRRVTSTKKKAYNVSTLENNFESSLTH